MKIMKNLFFLIMLISGYTICASDSYRNKKANSMLQCRLCFKTLSARGFGLHYRFCKQKKDLEKKSIWPQAAKQDRQKEKEELRKKEFIKFFLIEGLDNSAFDTDLFLRESVGAFNGFEPVHKFFVVEPARGPVTFRPLDPIVDPTGYQTLGHLAFQIKNNAESSDFLE